jgi:putative membrane protein
MMMYGFNHFSWLRMAFQLLLTLGVIVGLVLLIVWAVRMTTGKSNRSASQDTSTQSARDIAQTRYAKGEISREEYQQILDDLAK